MEALAEADRRESVVDKEKYPIPTEQELSTLRKVSDGIPTVAWLLCIVEFSERASYYGVQTIFSNFMEYPLPKGGNGAGAPPRGSEETAGALGKGLQFSNAFVLLFQFLAYVVPIFGGWYADTRIGRYKTILIGVLICGIAHIILIFGALPTVLKAGHGVAPFIISLLVLAFGAGVFKPNVAPTLIDQYQHQRPYTKVLKSGEKVLVDPETTVQRIMLIFYGLINVGAFFAIATTYSEKRVGYWLAFLLPGIIFLLLPLLLAYLNNKLIKYPPNGSELTKTFKIISVCLRENKFNPFKKGFWDAARPHKMAEKGKTADWSNKMVDDVHRTIKACGVFLYFPVWYLNDGGIGSVSTNQGSTMSTNGAPNDLLTNFNPLTIIVTIPILSHIVYPTLHRYNIKFGRIARITFGFTLAWISGVIGAIVQWRVYKTNPCGYYPTGCDIGDGVSTLNVWLQIPNIALGAISECFCNVTAYELAYARSPPNMKALVMALFLLMNALSAALGEILTPAIVDPHLIWVWGGPAIALFIQTVIFWFRYKHMDSDEFMLYEEEENRKYNAMAEPQAEPEITPIDEKRGEEEIAEGKAGAPAPEISSAEEEKKAV
ncbi:PTR2-domain-containing protein [Viridothelium virens]|uniref:PTR2-domain-containing protein n=1 Tax=Viridothelium virens TaxID=1048519 RepID=A0A6A6HM06_VIRVR|nr:PTR2-domain-containing protein [Viridothelium virens]